MRLTVDADVHRLLPPRSAPWQCGSSLPGPWDASSVGVACRTAANGWRRPSSARTLACELSRCNGDARPRRLFGSFIDARLKARQTLERLRVLHVDESEHLEYV